MLERRGYKKIDFAQPDALKPLYAAARSGKPAKTFAVLNARFHEQEAFIVAEAGVPGAITVATNMAGRGTDIQLGGNVDMRIRQETDPNATPEELAARETEIRAEVAEFKQKAIDAGGLYIIGTERHESRRIDNQLRGRSGRQGDPGRSKFFLSLQDDLMRIFGAERMDAMLQAPRTERGRGDRPPVDQQGAREGAAEGRGAQLRHPQEHSQVRQCDERPAQGHLRGPAQDDGVGIARIRRSRTCARASSMTSSPNIFPHDAYPEAWDIAGLKTDVENKLGLDLPVDGWAKEEGIADEESRGQAA